MKKPVSLVVFTFAALLLLPSSGYAQELPELGPDIERERLAQSGMKFLSVSVSPRAAALSDAVTAQDASSTSLFYNPAGMARLDGMVHASLGQVQWISTFRYNTGTVAFRPADGNYGVIGLSVRAVDYGDFKSTIRADNEQGYQNIGSVTPSALAVGVGYARTLTDRFSVGGHLKYARQSLGESTMRFDESGSRATQDNTSSTLAADFGVIYRTGFESLNLGVSVRNFSREVTYVEESFELPMTIEIGAAMDIFDFYQAAGENHSFVLSLNAESPRDYDEQLKIGGEYTFMDLFSLRAGYLYPSDEQGLSLGGGLQLELGGIGFGADYAYTQFGRLGNINRVGVQFQL